MALLYLLSLVFGWHDLARLGSDDYRTRERATARLAALWPLSEFALHEGVRSADPEVRQRSFEARNRGGASRSSVPLLYAVAAEPDRFRWLAGVDAALIRPGVLRCAARDGTGKRLLALWLIYAPFEDYDGLPWVPATIHKRYWQDVALARALCDVVRECRLCPFGDDSVLACDPDVPLFRTPGYLFGLDNVRFWARGLSDPQFEARPGSQKYANAQMQWAKQKARGLTVPPPPPTKE